MVAPLCLVGRTDFRMKLDTALDDLGIDNIELLHLFLLKINGPTGITDHLMEQIAEFSRCDLGTLYRMKKQLEQLSELFAESYHCCPKSCVCQEYG